MTTEHLRTIHHARPFRPFTIHTADGRSLHVPHSEFLDHSGTGQTVIVHDSDGSFSMIDLRLVREIDVHALSPANGL
jgi:hypothetical protein